MRDVPKKRQMADDEIVTLSIKVPKTTRDAIIMDMALRRMGNNVSTWVRQGIDEKLTRQKAS